MMIPGLLLTSCDDDNSSPEEPLDTMTVTFTAEPSEYDYYGLNLGGGLTRSDYPHINAKEPIKSRYYAFYKDGSLIEQNTTGKLSNVRSRDVLDIYAISNVASWTYPEKESDLAGMTMEAPAIASFSENGGVPQAGSLLNWNVGKNKGSFNFKMKRLYSLVQLDFSIPDGWTPSDVTLYEFYAINQNAVLMPFGESYYHEGEAGCAKVDDDKTDGYRYGTNGESITELTDGKYFIYIPENSSLKSKKTITPTYFKLSLSYKKDGVLNSIDTTYVIGSYGYGADSAKIFKGQCKRNILINLNVFSQESEVIDFDPISLSSLYVAQKPTFPISVTNVDAGDITVKGDGEYVSAEIAPATRSSVGFNVTVSALKAGTGTITFKYKGSNIKSVEIPVSAPTIQFDTTTYTLTNSVSSQTIGASYKEGERGTFFDAALYDKLLAITKSKAKGDAFYLINVDDNKSTVALANGIKITSSNAGTYSNAITASPASADCGVESVNATVDLELLKITKTVNIKLSLHSYRDSITMDNIANKVTFVLGDKSATVTRNFSGYFESPIYNPYVLYNDSRYESFTVSYNEDETFESWLKSSGSKIIVQGMSKSDFYFDYSLDKTTCDISGLSVGYDGSISLYDLYKSMKENDDASQSYSVKSKCTEKNDVITFDLSCFVWYPVKPVRIVYEFNSYNANIITDNWFYGDEIHDDKLGKKYMTVTHQGVKHTLEKFNITRRSGSFVYGVQNTGSSIPDLKYFDLKMNYNVYSAVDEEANYYGKSYETRSIFRKHLKSLGSSSSEWTPASISVPLNYKKPSDLDYSGNFYSIKYSDDAGNVAINTGYDDVDPTNITLDVLQYCSDYFLSETNDEIVLRIPIHIFDYMPATVDYDETIAYTNGFGPSSSLSGKKHVDLKAKIYMSPDNIVVTGTYPNLECKLRNDVTLSFSVGMNSNVYYYLKAGDDVTFDSKLTQDGPLYPLKHMISVPTFNVIICAKNLTFKSSTDPSFYDINVDFNSICLGSFNSYAYGYFKGSSKSCVHYMPYNTGSISH